MALSGLVDEGRQVFEEVEIMSQMVAGTGCIGREGRGGPVGNWWALLPFAPVGMARFPFFSLSWSRGFDAGRVTPVKDSLRRE